VEIASSLLILTKRSESSDSESGDSESGDSEKQG
jgi:hypothetical protein